MVSTLPFLNPSLSLKPFQNGLHLPSNTSKQVNLPKPSLPNKTHFSKAANQPQYLLQHLQHTIRQLQTSPLPAAALAVPFFLDPKVTNSLKKEKQKYPPISSNHNTTMMTSNSLVFACLLVSMCGCANVTGCSCRWGRIRAVGGSDLCTHSSAGDGESLLLHTVGWLSWLAMATNPHHPGRDQCAQEAGEAYGCIRHCRWRTGTGSAAIDFSR